MNRACLPVLLLLVARGASAQAPAEPAPAPDAAAPAPDVTEPAKPALVVQDDPYLTNYKKYEHRDERAPGRGPQGRKIGFGLSLGRPVGLNAKIYFTQTIGFQADVGTTYSWNGPEISFSGHLVWHPYTLMTTEQFKINTYVGGGARGAFWPAVIVGIPDWLPNCKKIIDLQSVTNSANLNDGCSTGGTSPQHFPGGRPAQIYVPQGEDFPGTLGVQGLVGIDIQFQKFPMELFAQPIATLEVFPGLSFDLGAQVGCRWYFF